MFYDEHGDATDYQLMWWAEANDHADDADQADGEAPDRPGDSGPNPYARAIAAGNYAILWVCSDCFILHCNGDDNPERPADLPPLLGTVPKDADLSAGLLSSEHANECTPEDRAEGCTCESHTYSTSACDGCGDRHHGERHAMTLVYVVRPEPDSTPPF